MKTLIGLMMSIALLTSCLKEHSCYCYDNQGNSLSGSSTKTNSQSKINKLKTDCAAADASYKSSQLGYCTYK